jgi:hypothetical protein
MATYFPHVNRVEAVTLPNEQMLRRIDEILLEASQGDPAVLAIEMIASYGMAVGAEVFETCVWIGRFCERWASTTGAPPVRIARMAVKLAICHDSRAKDANIRAALIDQFGGALATKKGGALYRVKGDEWAALALAMTCNIGGRRTA